MESRLKKVMFFSIDNALDGGSFLSLVGLAVKLRENYGIAPYVALPHEGNGIELLKKHDIPYIVVPSYGWGWPIQCKKTLLGILHKFGEKRKTKKAAKFLAAYAKENGIELIHINSSAVYVGALVANRIGVPYVWHFREFMREGLNQSYLWPGLAKKLYNRASAILTISWPLFKYCTNTLSNNSIYMVGNAVSIDGQASERSLFSSGKIHFAIIGIITENKGHYDMLHAVSLLARKYSADVFDVLVIGRPNEEFATEISRRGLNQYIKLLGFQADVPTILKTVDVLLMCAVNEGFGRVTAEAMVAGCLVIGARSGGTTDMVIDGQTGILFPPHNFDVLAKKMDYVIQNPKEVVPLAKNGQKLIYQCYSYDKNASAVATVYNSVKASAFKAG